MSIPLLLALLYIGGIVSTYAFLVAIVYLVPGNPLPECSEVDLHIVLAVTAILWPAYWLWILKRW